MDVRNLKVLVAGLGTSGIDACTLLHDNGAIVFGSDAGKCEAQKNRINDLTKKFIEVETGGHTEKFMKGADLVVVSPGVPKDALPISYALRNNIPVISEMELGSYFTKGRIIAVTGTNGKSTVVTLLGKILRDAGKKVNVCGNIGNSLSGEVKNITRDTIVVLEVSSFQLEWIIDFKPAVSCILNITEDHLERYKDFDDYALAKYRIFEKQAAGDITVLNYDDPRLKNIPVPVNAKKFYYSRLEQIDGMFSKGKDIYINKKGGREKLFTLPDTRLKGFHNLENIMAAVIMALSQGAELDVIVKAIADFKPLRHRIEKVGEVNGVDFIDDSKATNVDGVKRALEGMDKEVILIAGGRDKGGDYLAVENEIRSKVKKLILIGEAAEKINKIFNGMVKTEIAGSLEDAVVRAYKAAKPGDAVLLSPMCSSFDMFRDYTGIIYPVLFSKPLLPCLYCLNSR